MFSPNKFFALTSHCALKRLEGPCLYDIQKDDLYELSEDAYQFLLRCSRGERPSVRKEDEGFLRYCLSENLITISEVPVIVDRPSNPSPIPSLRYLELQITDRCNLRCRHCYLSDGPVLDLPLEKVQRVLEQFEEIQGLRLLLSGGEPMLHPRFWEINSLLTDCAFRAVLLSNGTLITEESAKRLRVHEVQLSLDGVKEGHELLRGKGTFNKALAAIDHLQKANIRVSIATMIHRGDLKEFDSLASLLKSKNIEEWNIDQPSIAGRLEENRELWVSPSEAAPLLQYGYGGGWHGSSEKNSTCGAHLCAVLSTGDVSKCGLFSQEPVGSTEDGLRACWNRIPRIRLNDLRCNCSGIEECKGGCRYRAKLHGDIFQPDLFQCYARGVLKGGEEDDN